MKLQTHKSTVIRLFLILIIVLISLVINLQAQTQTASIANVSRTSADDCLKLTSQSQQRLEKVLTDLENAEILIKALQAENAKRKELNDLNDAIIEKKNAIIENQNKLIVELNKNKGLKISLFFGLLKITKN